LLGGTIWVKSEVGVGSTFYAEFPTVYKGAEEVGESTPHPQVAPTRVPVLAIEDNRETLDLYHNYLRNSRFQLITASRLTDARRLVREIQPAAILLDILLHDESTWTFLTEMKSSHTTRSIPVIVATVVDNRTKAEALGADEFVVKPVERDWLLATLNRYVQRDERARVLLIDDDEVSRYVMREVLGRTRYAVTEASSAREGMLRARQMRPQAIFLDLNMPEMNGFDALDEVKRDPATRDIPVIVITSKLLTEEERKRLEANAVAVMSKEFSSRDEAVAIIDAALLKAGVTAVQTVSA
jgi:CheY-like chemotaxis protein